MASLPPKKQETIHIEPELYWSPEWSWVFDVVRDNPLTFDGYSTFPPGEEPDVWPVLPPPSRNDGVGIVVACAAAAMVFGTMLHRWRMTRIRIT
jgi:hypothetical protein